MVDTARQLLDELMGRNRNLDPVAAKNKKIQWDDPEFCLYYLVKFCPHELFVNTRADLGQCTKLHDDEAKRLYNEARPSVRKRNHEDEFLRFSNHMINEVDRKIAKGKQRLQLMNKPAEAAPPPPVFVSKFQEQVNNLDARINKLINEAEEAGIRGDVDQAQGLMSLCDQLKEEKDALITEHENSENGSDSAEKPIEPTSNEKQMEVCEVCGAFLIVGDAQQRIEDHLTGKQHLGYSRLRNAIDEMYEQRRKDAEAMEKQRDGDRRPRNDNARQWDRRDDRRERGDRRDDRRRRDDNDDRGGRRGGFDQDRRRDFDRDRAGHHNRGRDYRDNRNRNGRRDDRDRHGDRGHRSRSNSRQ